MPASCAKSGQRDGSRKVLKSKGIEVLTDLDISGVKVYTHLSRTKDSYFLKELSYYMRKVPGRDTIVFYAPEKLKEDFSKERPNGEMSDTLRGMIMLYLKDPLFRKSVDAFVSVTKTI